MIDLTKWSNWHFRLLSILWTIIIFYLTLAPDDGGQSWYSSIPHFDKLAHIGLFFIWSVFLMLNFRTSENISAKNVTTVIGIGLLLGGLTEYLQGFVEGRNEDLSDFVADSMGIGLGIFFTFLAKKNDYLMY